MILKNMNNIWNEKNKEVIVKNFDDPIKLFVFLIEESSFESSINLWEHFIEELQEIIHIIIWILFGRI